MAAANLNDEPPPLKNVHVWITDLQSIPEHPSNISTFNIMGTVVGCISPANLEDSSRPIGYKIDDGTGVIKVVQFIQNRIRKQNDRKLMNVLRSSGNASGNEEFVAKTRKMLEVSRSNFNIGTIVEAKGKLQFFRGEAELMAFSVREVQEMNSEIERTILMAKMKEDNLYPMPLFRKK